MLISLSKKRATRRRNRAHGRRQTGPLDDSLPCRSEALLLKFFRLRTRRPIMKRKITTVTAILLAGALGGAAAGGLIGAAVGHPGAGAAIGGALGLGGGALVGDQLQGQQNRQADQQRQIDANQAELDRQRRELEKLRRQGEY